MAGRTVSIELTDEQAALLDEIAAGERIDPDKLLLEAVAHGLAMIVAGIDEDELHNATRDPPDSAFQKVLPDPPKKRGRRKPGDEPGTWERQGTGDLDDDIPF